MWKQGGSRWKMSPHYKRNSYTYNPQHYKEHLIPINGGRGNLFNEELKVTPGDGGKRREERCFVWRKKNRARLSGASAWSREGLCVDVDTDNVYQVGEKVKRCHHRVVRTVSLGQIKLTLQIRGREGDQLRSKYKNPTENSILFMSVAPSPQTAGCDIMMGLWLQFEYSIWSFLSTRGFALQITTRSQKCLNYRYDRTDD